MTQATETIINREGWMIGDGGSSCVEGWDDISEDWGGLG